MTRPGARFAITALLGAALSLSISVSLIVLVVAVVLVVLVAFVSQNSVASGGVLFGWGLCWFLLIGSNYLRCVAMGPDCGGAEGMLPFVAVGASLAAAGIGLAARAALLERHAIKS